MKYKSVFDIIGPIMVGPSSSHTAGAARIGRVARTLFGREPKNIHVHLYGSFASTYQGHGTDVAIVGGILDFDTYDERIPNSLKIAEEKGITVKFYVEDAIPEHPNTARIVMGDERETIEITGISIGGGKIEIIELNGFKLRLSGVHPALLVVHNDRYGVIADVTKILSAYKINIGHMEVSRKSVGDMALMIIETDSKVPDVVINQLNEIKNVMNIITMNE